MAVCPNCGKKLRFIDWKQDCPSCGVNLIYFGSNERLLEESEKAEIEHAKHQPGIDRAKASIFGSPQAIARLVLSVIPLGALFLPLCKSGGKSVNAIGIYKYISSNDFGKIISNALGGKAPDLSLILLLVSAVLILVSSICLVMSLGRHGKIRNLIFDSIKLLCAVTAGAALIAAGGYSLSAGAFVYIALFAALLVYNLVLAKKGLPVKHTVCYIGGLPSEEYYKYVEEGMSELEIRKKMVDALTAMQEDVRRKEEEARAKEEEQRSKMK